MQDHTGQAVELMSAFAERTGLGDGDDQQRYLWTDAFALVNALCLWRETEQARWREMATDLVTDVHRVLGRHRSDDPRSGWLSGLDEEEGAAHPTVGGLRIGKPLPERGPDEPRDERLEWDRDGQYWHYLTKWMDALSRAAVVLGEPRHQEHAEELAASVFPRFLQTTAAGEPVGLAWKMSVDLSRPQVPGISPHDALDGYVTFRWLGRTGRQTGLGDETATLRRLAEDRDWETGDPLGLGGLLLDTFRLALLADRTADDERLIAVILAGATRGLARALRSGTFEMPAGRRLGFRELGLAIGLQTLPAMADAADASASLERAVTPHLAELQRTADVGGRIVAFWSDPANRRAATWGEHRDINEVMLATALLDAFVDTARVEPTSADPRSP